MRRSGIISVLAVGLYIGLGVSAFAKPHHPPPPPPPPPAWSWTGFYTGLNLGYSWGRSSFGENFVDTTGTSLFITNGTVNNINGVIGGGQIGYNWQFGNWVPGLEADFQGSGEQGSATTLCPAGICSVNPVTTVLNEKLEWFGTVRGRLGWTVTPETMVYATGGLAYGKLTDSGTISNIVTTTPFSFSKTSVGWTAGGGVEGHLVGNWTWKVEYLFMALNEPSGTVTTPIPSINRGNTDNPVFDPLFTDNIVRAGVNYKWQ